jgi:hypothetical protein
VRRRRRLAGAALAALVLLAAVPAAVFAQDEEPNIEFPYPLVTRRPVIERELEIRVKHEKGRDGRESELAAAVELPLLPRWQIELEVPLVFTEPRDAPAMAGVGDVEIDTKVLLFKSAQYRVLVAGGVELTLPTGSERRGLGGEAAVEPYLTGAIGLGPVDLLADVEWEANVNANVPGPQEQELAGGAMAAYRLSRWFTPLVELRTKTRMRGEEEAAEGEPGRLHATQVSIVPGFNVNPFPGSTLAVGVELPLTDARSADYIVHTRFVWEF